MQQKKNLSLSMTTAYDHKFYDTHTNPAFYICQHQTMNASAFASYLLINIILDAPLCI